MKLGRPFLHWLVLSVPVLIFGWFYLPYAQDDPYLTYRYAENIARGLGFVYNAGERVLGTTSPLYALILAALYPVSPNIPLTSNVISTASIAVAVLVAFVLARQLTGFWTAFLIALSLAVNPLMYISFGMETPLYVALLLATFTLYWKGRYSLAAVMAGLLTLTRPDGVILAIVLLGDLGLRRRRIPVQSLAAYLATISPWLLFSLFYFGSPITNTLAAKADYFGGLSFLIDAKHWWEFMFAWRTPLQYVVALPGFLAVPTALKHAQARLLVIWALSYAAGYTFLNASAFWYYTPLLPVLTILIGWGVFIAIRWLWQEVFLSPPTRRGFVFAVILAVSWLLVGETAEAWAQRHSPERMETYRRVGLWLREHTDPKSTVGVGDVGIVGYYSQRAMIENNALVRRDVLERDLTYMVLKFLPDYVVATSYWPWNDFVQLSWFQELYRPVFATAVPGEPFSPVVVFVRTVAMPETLPWLDIELVPGLRLLRAGISQSHLVAGETAYTILEFTASRKINSDYLLVAELADTDRGLVWASAQQKPLYNQHPTSLWHPEEKMLNILPIPLPPDIPVGDYNVTLTVESGAGSSEAVMSEVIVGRVTVGSLDALPDFNPLPPVRFGKLGQLLGYRFQDPGGWPGGSIPLVLYWQPLERGDKDYSVFVHLVDGSGQIVAQDDAYPGGGDYPTSEWVPGSIVPDYHQIALPVDLTPGRYGLWTGIYYWKTGERLPATSSRGAQIENDALFLAGITVEPP